MTAFCLPNPTPLSELDLLDRDGFFVLPSFLAPEACADVLNGIASAASDPESTRVRRGVAFARRNLLNAPFVQGLIARPDVAALLDIVAHGLIAVRAILFDKCGEANWTVPWHQDRSIAVQERRDDVPGFGPWSEKAGVTHVQPPVGFLKQMVTLRFSLDMCGPDNGPLRVIPGTHTRLLDAAELAKVSAEQKQTLCSTNAGGVVVMRPLILHASSPASNPSHRRILHIEFGPRSLPGGLRRARAKPRH